MLAALAAVLALGLGGSSASAQCGYTALGVGSSVACGIRADDSTLDCWGTESGGVLSGVPSTPAAFVDVGYSVGCLIKLSDNTLECWGASGGTLDGASPPAGTFLTVSVGTDSACGLRTDGDVVCWGATGGFDAAAPGGTFTALHGSDDVYCGISGGAVTCWGYDFSTGLFTEPSGTTFTQVANTATHACARKSDNTVECWGDNTSGEATAPGGTFLDVHVVYSSSCGRTTLNGFECWGDDSPWTSPAPTNCDYTAASSESSSNYCALDSEGNIFCWGWFASTADDAPDGGCAITPTSCATTTTTMPADAPVAVILFQ
jgi:hypothetical protein